MVRVVRLERTVSWSQTRRDTNFAIPGYSLFCHDTTARGKNKVFSVCGHLCGQSRFCAVFGNRWKSRKCRCHKALRRFASPYPGYNHGAPKPRVLSAELHPDIHFSAMIPRRGVKIKIFLSVVIPVVKSAFVPFSATGGKPAIARAARLCGLLSKPRMDRVYALPNQARYQLRYTRIKICRPHPGGISTIPAFFLACKGKICLGAFCIPGAFPPPPDYSPSAAFRASTRSVFSQATPRSSRPIWP